MARSSAWPRRSRPWKSSRIDVWAGWHGPGIHRAGRRQRRCHRLCLPVQLDGQREERRKRLETVKRADTDRSVVKASRDRVAEAAKRRKSVQDSLKELDEKNKVKNVNLKKPPLKVQIRQAGMQVDISRFYIYSAVCGAILTAVALVLGAPAHRPAGRVSGWRRSACRAGSSRSAAGAGSRRFSTNSPMRST